MMSRHDVRRVGLYALLAACAGCVRNAGPQRPAASERSGAWDSPGTSRGQEIVGPDGGKMVWVPPGEFAMGSTEGNDDEKPVHRVRLTRGFWLGQCEVTNAQYRRYCAEARRRPPRRSRQGDDHPVVYVSWRDAMAYCEFYGLQLPTEAQWEFAARGPQSHKYPWGNEWDPRKCCNDENRGPRGKTCPVGSFPAGASWCGALDLAGNVSEWCQEWMVLDYYARSPEDDPPGPAQAVDYPEFGEVRVLRGGAWCDLKLCRSACRNGDSVSAQDDNYGFRCAVVPGPAAGADPTLTVGAAGSR